MFVFVCGPLIICLLLGKGWSHIFGVKERREGEVGGRRQGGRKERRGKEINDDFVV